MRTPSNLPPGVTDCDIDEAAGAYEDELEDMRRIRPKHRMIGVVAFTAGHLERRYGGPEEGCWYYDHFTPTRVLYVPKAKAERCAYLLHCWLEASNKGRRPLSSVFNDGMAAYCSGIEPATPRPHYE